MEKNDETVNQDPGDVNATTESNRECQDKVSNPADTNCNDGNPNSSLDQSIHRDSNHKVDGRDKKVDADSIQTNVNQESNTTCGPGGKGNGYEMNKGNANVNNETENNAHFVHSKSKQMGNIFGKEKERNKDNGKCSRKSEDGNNKTNTEKKGETCLKKDDIENEQSCNKGTGPNANTNEDKQVFSNANRKTVEERTSSVEIIIQVVSEIDNEPPCGNVTEPVGNNTEDKRGIKQDTRDNSEKDPKLNDLTNETIQTTNEAVNVQSEDEIYDLPTLNNTGDTSAAVQTNCSNEPPRDTSDPLADDVNKDCVETAPNNIGDNCEPIETTDDKNNNTVENVEPTPSSTISIRCYCYCYHCGRLRCCNLCCCRSCCRPNDNTTPVCCGTDQNCSGHNNERNSSYNEEVSNEPTGSDCHNNCQNFSRPNVNEPTGSDCHSNCQNQNCSRPNKSNNEPIASVCDNSFRPTHTSSPLKRRTNEQNELEVTPNKRRKLFHDKDPNNESGDGDNNDKNNTLDTVGERINRQTRDNDGDERNSTVCGICHDTSKTKYDTCHHNTRCETCDRQNGYEPAGYCGQNCRPRSSRSRCDYWANNKTTQTNDECIENPNEKSTQTCFSYVKDEGKTFTNDTKVFGEKSWADNNKSNPRQTGRKLGKQSFHNQHSDDLYRNDTQPPGKKRKQNKDITKYDEQYHHNAYLNYYVRLFREERFQGKRASEVAKYAGYEWRSRMSEKEKRPYYEMRKLALPKSIKIKNKKTNKFNMME